MAWTEEQKQQVIDKYKARNPTPETSTEIIKEIADEMEQSPNGVRMILVQAQEYVKKEVTATTKPGKAGETKTPRVSKEASIKALKEAIEAKGATVDDEILDKLTGKAAVYFVSVLQA